MFETEVHGRTGDRDMKRILLPGLLALSLLWAGCSGVVGAGGENAPPADAASGEVAVAPDWGAGDLAHDAEATEDAESVADLAEGPAVSGCVSCHTDQDRLYALAPPVPHEGEESGGG